MSDVKRRICIDFDDVIHSYAGWEPGQNPGYIAGTVMEGAKEAIAELRKDYEVVVLSARASRPAGARGIAKWLKEHGIEVDGITATKPPAGIYIDDRAIRFDGDWVQALEQVKGFMTWRERHDKTRRA